MPMSACVHASVFAVYMRRCMSAYFSLKTRPREAAWERLFVFTTVFILVKTLYNEPHGLACAKVNRASLYILFKLTRDFPAIY